MFPQSAFDDQLKKFGKFGLINSILVLPMMTSNPEDCPDLNKSSEVAQELQFTSSSTIDAYTKRMRGVFQDMFDLGYI